MSKTKVEHILKAFKYLRISGLTTEPTPVEKEDALETLEDMMNEFQSRNICSTYVFEEEPELNTDSEVSSSINNAIATCLALRLAPSFGIQLNNDIRLMARTGLSTWSARSSKTNQMQPPRRQPKGSGNTFRFTNYTRYYRMDEDAPISCSTFELKVDEVDFFSVDFTNYLLEDATITSYTLENTNGIDVLNNSQDGNSINLECKGIIAGYQTVTINVTTSTGRINPEVVNFNIT